jgi:hypothetical protein
MVANLFGHELLLLELLWLRVIVDYVWADDRAGSCPAIPQPSMPPRKHSREPIPGACSGHLFGHALASLLPPFCKGGNRGETMANKVPCFHTRAVSGRGR